MIARYAPIPCPLPDQRKPGPRCTPPVLEFARAVPCESGMDDMADYAASMGREALEGMLVVECPEVAR
jgi:hypothetical protein